MWRCKFDAYIKCAKKLPTESELKMKETRAERVQEREGEHNKILISSFVFCLYVHMTMNASIFSTKTKFETILI